MKLVVGYLATPGGADAVALGVRLARTIGAELEVRLCLEAGRTSEADRAVARIPKLEERHWNLLYVRGIANERAKNWPPAASTIRNSWISHQRQRRQSAIAIPWARHPP